MRALPVMRSSLLAAGVVWLSCGFGIPNLADPGAPILVTASPVYDPLAALRGAERFPQGAQLLLVRQAHATPLIEGFAATADASVSFDAAKLLLAAKQRPEDKWAIWEYTFADHSMRKVIAGDSDAIRPLYLPENRLVYARLDAHGFHLESAQLDGSHTQLLSHVPASAIPQAVLADGRILFEAAFPLGTTPEQGGIPELFLAYSDGSGVESYRCDHGSARWGGLQLASGDVVFTHGTALAEFTSPLAREAPLGAPRAEYDGALAELSSGDLLVSSRPSSTARYALQAWTRGTKLLRPLLFRNDQNLVEPVLLAPRARPHRHPSALHNWDYANLLALDVHQSRDGALKGDPTAVRMEALDPSGKAVALGTAPVEGDGSFFVKVPGDRPVRFAVLDAKGNVLRAERGWFWIRNGEQRYCVGCHAGPEHAPENRVPSVLLRTTIAYDLTGADRSLASGARP